MQGPSVAHMYVRHGTFVVDVCASVPLVVLPFVGANKSAIIVVLLLRILRLVRVYKIINMLFYIQMVSVSGASGWRMLLGNVLSTIYTISVMINFCACLWYYVGTIGDEGVEGWLAQEYSTLSTLGALHLIIYSMQHWLLHLILAAVACNTVMWPFQNECTWVTPKNCYLSMVHVQEYVLHTQSVFSETPCKRTSIEDSLLAEFQGPPDEAKCEAYELQLADEGKDDLVELVDCAALWFDKEKVGLWLISIYFVVVTLTTCVLFHFLSYTAILQCL